jgi:hypothetical protein
MWRRRSRKPNDVGAILYFLVARPFESFANSGLRRLSFTSYSKGAAYKISQAAGESLLTDGNYCLCKFRVREPDGALVFSLA